MGDITLGPERQPFGYPVVFRFNVVQGRVLGFRPKFGYGCRSIELSLGKNALALSAHLAYLCGLHSVGNVWAVYRALEEIAGHTVDTSVELMRSLAAEIERIIDHLSLLEALAHALSWTTVRSLLGQLKDMAIRAAKAVGGLPLGVRFGFGSFSIWGTDLEALTATIGAMQPLCHALVETILRHPSFGERSIGLAKIGASAASETGLVGFVARASGIANDTRLVDPYGLYRDFAPSVATQTAGDAYARVAVIGAELIDSVRLVREMATNASNSILPKRRPLELYPGRRVARVEGPRGETVAVVGIDADRRVSVLHVRTASAANLACLTTALESVHSEDWPLAYLSLGLCGACVDR